MADSAYCPECDWRREAAAPVPDRLVAIVNELEGHLASSHDWTWQRAHEHARAWSRQVLQLPELQSTAEQHRATRTAHCPQCDWQTRARTEELIEISRCSGELDEHLRSVHKATHAEAAQASEGWALALIRGRIR